MKLYEFVGIGFGPANLSLAIALVEDEIMDRNSKFIFLESKPQFAWHENMLLPEAEMQVSFFKDLVTLRNPTSKFTFINYLFEKRKLEKFINLKTFFPYRIEYNDYLRWAAKNFDSYVQYNSAVESITPVYDENEAYVDCLKISYLNNGRKKFIYTKNIGMATGITSKTPIVTNNLKNIIHSKDFLQNLKSNFKDKSKDYKFLVVGSGQSAIENVLHLANEYPNASVKLLFKKFAIRPADDTEFVNEIFNIDNVSKFFNYEDELRQAILSQHLNTNYSVADAEIISILYKKLYSQEIINVNQIEIYNLSSLVGLSECQSKAIFKNLVTNENFNLEFDLLCMSTGYITDNKLLKDLDIFITYDKNSNLNINEDYLLECDKSQFGPNIFIQGKSEHKHGLSETLLSVLPYRAGKIAKKLGEIINKNNGGTTI